MGKNEIAFEEPWSKSMEKNPKAFSEMIQEKAHISSIIEEKKKDLPMISTEKIIWL